MGHPHARTHPWHVSFIVNCLEGPILLTIDAVFVNENLKLGVAPSDYMGCDKGPGNIG